MPGRCGIAERDTLPALEDPMTIEERVTADMKAAMRNKQADALRALRTRFPRALRAHYRLGAQQTAKH